MFSEILSQIVVELLLVLESSTAPRVRDAGFGWPRRRLDSTSVAERRSAMSACGREVIILIDVFERSWIDNGNNRNETDDRDVC